MGNVRPRYNAAPNQELLVIRRITRQASVRSTIKWGLIPHWCKDWRGGRKPINAKAESALPSFPCSKRLMLSGAASCLSKASSSGERLRAHAPSSCQGMGVVSAAQPCNPLGIGIAKKAIRQKMAVTVSGGLGGIVPHSSHAPARLDRVICG